MTEQQWRAAWVLCETAGNLDLQAQREYVRGATVDPEVERQVISVLEELASGPSFPPAPDRRAGDTIGRYVLIARIGEGGMGEIYSAEDTELHRQVALKFLPADLPSPLTASAQIIREARAASALNHPNIVTVYEIIQTQWGLAIVMELVEGQSLRAMLKVGLKAGRLSRRNVIRVGRQIAGALAAAHAKGIVHRDIKPENIMVRPDGYVKVMDFGLAQRIRERTASGNMPALPVGTVRYMSPEQKRGEAITGASDLYSLALVLEEASQWRHPLLTHLRNQQPELRPTAATAALQFERLERSGRNASIAVGLTVLTALVVFFAVQNWKERRMLREPVFEQITRKTESHDVTAAGLSPDGKRLAYATVDGGLFLRDNSTGATRELDIPQGLSIYRLLFPFDGGLLAVGTTPGSSFDVWRISSEGRPAMRLRTNVEVATLSHDGKQLAWLTRDRQQVWVGPVYGGSSRQLFTVSAAERIPIILWSGDDTRLWFLRLGACGSGVSPEDGFVNPDYCGTSDLAVYDLERHRFTNRIRDIWLNSGFFTTTGDLLFIRADDRLGRSHAFYNLWSMRTDLQTGRVLSAPRQLSHLRRAILAQLTGTLDGKSLSVVRTERFQQTYVADWRGESDPALANLRRLTLEETNSFPHAWATDNQSVIFESDRNGTGDLFRQKLSWLDAEVLVATPEEKYMPQVTPDGKWILYASFKPGTKPGDFYFNHPQRLMRIPYDGGKPAEVPIGSPLDEFRCSLPGRGTNCVLRATGDWAAVLSEPKTKRTSPVQTYYELDPVTGKGRELAKTRSVVGGLGRWALSADGTKVDIPDDTPRGQFTEITLSPVITDRSESVKHVAGIGTINGMNPVPSGKGWLAWARSEGPSINLVILPSFLEDAWRTERLYYIDPRTNPHLLFRSYLDTYGVFSPDEKHIAVLGVEIASNAWFFKQ
ncbi:MAG: protein kinase [Acidobacteriota bacterium]|nr:protein kinase [Acidobacteriota bacterium]